MAVKYPTTKPLSPAQGLPNRTHIVSHETLPHLVPGTAQQRQAQLSSFQTGASWSLAGLVLVEKMSHQGTGCSHLTTAQTGSEGRAWVSQMPGKCRQI